LEKLGIVSPLIASTGIWGKIRMGINKKYANTLKEKHAFIADLPVKEMKTGSLLAVQGSSSFSAT
jgi:hypothetical protein